MRQFMAAAMAIGMLAGGLGAADAAKPAPAPAFPPGTAAEHAAYSSACVRQSGNKTLCECLAGLAMTADPQLRADMIMSMSNPDKYRTTRAPHVPNNGPEMQAWEQFDVDGHGKCGMDI